MEKSRWYEASTWAGLGAVLAAIAPVTGLAGPFVAAAAAACGGIAVVLRDGTDK